MPHLSYQYSRSQSGFTIMELMIVVTLLAVIAGMVISSQGDTVDRAELQATRHEMTVLRDALLRYHTDVGSFPADIERASPADLGFLFEKPAGIDEWNPDYRLGWRGPYLRGGDRGFVIIGDSLGFDGSGSAEADDPASGNDCGASGDNDVLAVPDAFTADATANGWFTWRQTSCDDNTIFRAGRPYLVFDLAAYDAGDLTIDPRIVSMGPDGQYELTGSETEPCASTVDEGSLSGDLVLCLR